MLRHSLRIRRRAVTVRGALTCGRLPSGHKPNSLLTRAYHGATETPGMKQKGQTAGVTEVDLRSDTITRPSERMMEAMMGAKLGDDVLGDDPTVQELEHLAAQMMGFEAAIFVPTGTQANLIAIMAHCTRRDSEILMGDKSHTHLYERGNCASIAGVHPRTLPNNSNGTIDLVLLRSKIRSEDVHFPVTSLICLENTHNYCGGKILPLDYLDQVVELSRETGIPLHMDGARVANAAVALGVPMSRILKGFASSTLCLSKSLGAPIGSLLAGSTEFIKSARRIRKALGGGMRQVGVIAAPGIVAIETMDKLKEDNRHARILAEAVNECGCPGVCVDLVNLHTNIVLVELDPAVVKPADFCTRMATAPADEVSALGEEIVARMFPMSNTNVRMVLHCDITEVHVEKMVKKIRYVVGGLQRPSQVSAKKPKLERGSTLVVE